MRQTGRLSSLISTAWQTFADLLDPPESPYVSIRSGGCAIDWVSSGGQSSARSLRRSFVIATSPSRVLMTLAKSMEPLGQLHGGLISRQDPFATTTAPTTKQVHAILWRYIGQAHRKGNLAGRITLDDEWYMGPGGKELVAFGRKPADHDQSAFQGIHALSPLILVDEACGVQVNLRCRRRPGHQFECPCPGHREPGRSFIALRANMQAGVGLACDHGLCFRHSRIHG
jgi:hypothetical protein